MKLNNGFTHKIQELFGIDLRSLALFRIAIAVLIIADLIMRISDLEAFYTDDGVLPRSLHMQYYSYWYTSAYMFSGSKTFVSVLFLINALFALCLLIGYRTKLATFICWLLMVSLCARNPLILNLAYTLFCVLLFWSMFLPLGAKWSLDKALNSPIQRLSKYILSFGTVGILAQVVFMYWFTAILKIGPVWIDGSALYYSLSMEQYTKPFGAWFLNFPAFLKFLTYSTFWFEIVGPFFLFIPIFTRFIRTITIFIFIFFHLCLFLCLALGIFPFISSIAMILFLPSWFWDKLFGYFGKSEEESQKYCYTNIRLSRISNLLALFFLVYILFWNLGTIKDSKFKIPEKLELIGHILHIDQRWSMFALTPDVKKDGWHVIVGELADGAIIDLKDGEKLSWEKPSSILDTVTNKYWRNHLIKLYIGGNKKHILYYAKYICDKWNKNHTGSTRLKELKIYVMREDILPNYQKSKPKKELLGEYKCL